MKIRAIASALFLLVGQAVSGQINVGSPITAQGAYSITDTVFMDPNGNDANPGSNALPVQTFQAALGKLPFGTAGINGGNAYGLIVLKEGEYATNGFYQSTSQWQNGNTYKNVSIEGWGSVVVRGKVDTFSTNHLIMLLGDHIFIKNVQLKYGGIHGILTGRSVQYPRQQHILIEDVIVDSVMGFSILMTSCDTILVKNTKSLYAARPGADSLVTPCQWPSGIKFLGCSNIEVHDTEIAFTRGEGLNFHNSEYGLAYNNSLHDNGLNLYCDNSAHIVIRNNHIYNTPGIGKAYWRNCPADTGYTSAGIGIMLANEGACIHGNLPSFANCSVNCILPNESYSNVEDIYIYNNLIQNSGKALIFWEGVTSIAGVNCIRHVYVFNNTVAGLMADSLYDQPTLIQAFFPSYNWLLNANYSYLQDVRITNNIFTFDTAAFAKSYVFRQTWNALHPGPKDITFGNNLWIRGHTKMATGDMVRTGLPFDVPVDSASMKFLIPCNTRPELVYKVDQPAFTLNGDLLYHPRDTGQTNAGAFEYRDTCTMPAVELLDEFNMQVFPNPAGEWVYIKSVERGGQQTKIEIVDLAGKTMVHHYSRLNNLEAIRISHFPPGLYLMRISTGEGQIASRTFVKL